MVEFLDKLKRDLRMGWNMQTIAWTLVLIFIILQALGILFAKYITIRLGPVLLFAMITIIVLMAASIVKKQWGGRSIDKKDFFALVILVAVTILAVIYLESFMPQIFAEAASMLKVDLQSVFTFTINLQSQGFALFL